MKKSTRVFILPRTTDFLRLLTLLVLGAAGFTLSAVDEKFESFQPASNKLTERFEGYTTMGSNYIARFESFTAGSNTFANVTVLNTNRKDIFLRHAGGLVSVKVKDVDPEILKQLGYKVVEPEKKSANPFGTMSSQMMTNLTLKLEDDARFQQIESQWMARVAPHMPPISKGLIAGAVGVLVAIYLFFSFCCMQIVRKTGNQPGLLVWLPILKMLPLIRAAGMPGWWFLIWLAPIFIVVLAPVLAAASGVPPTWLLFCYPPAALGGLVTTVIWFFKIVGTRGKSVIWAIMLLLPVTNLIAFLYLAFSDGAAPEAKPTARSRPLARAA